MTTEDEKAFLAAGWSEKDFGDKIAPLGNSLPWQECNPDDDFYGGEVHNGSAFLTVDHSMNFGTLSNPTVTLPRLDDVYFELSRISPPIRTSRLQRQQ